MVITNLIGFSYWWKVVKIPPPPPPPKIDSLTIATPDSIKPEPDELQIKKTPEVEPAEDKKENVDVNGYEAAGINDTGSIKKPGKTTIGKGCGKTCLLSGNKHYVGFKW